MSDGTPGPHPPRASFLPGVIGFYLGIGTASLGGGVAATGFFLLSDVPSGKTVIIVGLVMIEIGRAHV